MRKLDWTKLKFSGKHPTTTEALEEVVPFDEEIIEPACPKCNRFQDCLSYARAGDVMAKCIWWGYLKDIASNSKVQFDKG